MMKVVTTQERRYSKCHLHTIALKNNNVSLRKTAQGVCLFFSQRNFPPALSTAFAKQVTLITDQHLDCKTAVFFANASDGPYSNERSGASEKTAREKITRPQSV